MSDFAALVVLVALGTANFFLIVYMGTWVSNLSEGIASGGFQGLPISIKHRRYLLQSRFVLNTGAVVLAGAFFAVGWYLIGANASSGDLKLPAYIACFLNGGLAVAWPISLPTHYRHLADQIRDAEG